jgi:hypothetical protein
MIGGEHARIYNFSLLQDIAARYETLIRTNIMTNVDTDKGF